MAVNLSAPDPKTIFPVAGVELGTTMASIRKANRRDMMVMRFTPGTHAAGVFTQNRFAAAPVQVCRAHQAVTKNVRGLVADGSTSGRTSQGGRQSCPKQLDRGSASHHDYRHSAKGVFHEGAH